MAQVTVRELDDRSDFWEHAARLRAATRDRSATDSATLIRLDRDRDLRTG